MELRSSRSRSRTPFVQLTRLEEADTMKQETIVRRSYATRNKTYTKSSSLSDEVFVEENNHKKTRNRHKTSDYSSEEEEEEVEEHSNGVKSALQVYQEAGEYWNKYPKTDYTYSSSSKDRVEVAPGVIGMPNMSRKSLRRSMEPTSTTTTTYHHQEYRNSNNNFAKKQLNFDDCTDYGGAQSVTIGRRLRASMRTMVTRIYRSILTVLMVVETTVLWAAQSYYKTVSRMFLFDTWLMQKTATRGAAGAGRKYGALVAIMLLPLLLFAGWTLWAFLTQNNEPQIRNVELKPQIKQEVNVQEPINVQDIIKQEVNVQERINVQDIIKQVLSSPEYVETLKQSRQQSATIHTLQTELNTLRNMYKEAELRYERSVRACCRSRQLWSFEGRINQLKSELKPPPYSTTPAESGDVSEGHIRSVVQALLATYDADKTGLVDYALESSGGQIISTRCTENYHSRTAVVSILGVPLWYPSNTPRVVITPGATPGECWAFQNFPGFVVVQLSAFVKVSAVSVEHIPESLAPGGVRDSAPRAFTVWGLESENDRAPFSFGRFEYRLEGPALQFFAVEQTATLFNIVELRVESNHGNMNYTCLYRFRVHGNL